MTVVTPPVVKPSDQARSDGASGPAHDVKRAHIRAVEAVLALVRQAGDLAGLAGRVTTMASAVVVMVSLVYDVTLIAIAQSASLGGPQATTALVSYGLFAAVEHIFLLAPPLLLPLGLILLRTPILPRPLAMLAVMLGVASPVLGLAGLFTVTVTANNNGPVGALINALVALDGLWIMAAAVILLVRGPVSSRPAAVQLRPAS